MGDNNGDAIERPLPSALRDLLQQQPDALVAAIDDDGLFVEMPASLSLGDHRTLGVRSALNLVQPTDRRWVIDAWVEAKASGSARAEVALVGTGAPALLHFFDTTDEHGVYIGVVTPAASAGAAHEDLDQIAELPPLPTRLAYSRKDEVATIVHVDAGVTEMLGWSPEEIVGERSLSFVHPEDQERAVDIWMECLSRPGATCRTRLRHRHRDGRWIWLELSNTNLLDDDTAGYVDCEMFDISEEMEAHEAVRRSEQLLRRLAESLPVGIAQFDVDHRILYANERLYDILGAGLDADDRALCASAVEPHVLEGAMQSVLRDGDDVDVGLEVERLDDGGRRQCTISVRSLTDEDGEIVGGVLVLDDVTEQTRLRRELEQRATYDGLTGCVNRQVAIGRLTEALSGADDRRSATAGGTAAIFVDLDEFKAVNDGHGHATGDAVLMAVADRLRAAVREGDVVGRLGGDEFLVVCPDVSDRAATEALARRLVDAIAEPIEVGGRSIRITASVGASFTHRDQGAGADTLIAEADTAMYEAKRGPAGGGAVLSAP